MTIREAFQKYDELFLHLSTLVDNWVSIWRELDTQIFKESYLKEITSDIEKENLERRILEIEEKIRACEIEIVNLINIIKTILQREFVYDLNVINFVNCKHVDAMQQYNYIVDLYNKTKDNYIRKNININFVDLEKSKKELKKQIIEFNVQVVGENNIGLLTPKEASDIADRETIELIRKRLSENTKKI